MFAFQYNVTSCEKCSWTTIVTDCPLLCACRVLIVSEYYQVIGKPVPRKILISDWLKVVSEQDCI